MRYTNLSRAARPGHQGLHRTGGRHTRRRGRDLDDALHRSVERRHDEGRQGLHPLDRRRATHATARRYRHVLADRHLGRPDARDAGEGPDVRRSARRGHLEDIASLRTAPLPARTSAAPPAAERSPTRCDIRTGRSRARIRRSAARPATSGRSRARQRFRHPLEQRRLREARRACGRGAATSSTPTARSSEARSSSPSIACSSSRGASIGSSRHPLDPDHGSDACRKTSPSPTASGSCAASSTVSGKPLPMMEGQVTLVLKRTSGWLIEAYRYTIKPPAAPQTTPAPLPKRPGGGLM